MKNKIKALLTAAMISLTSIPFTASLSANADDFEYPTEILSSDYYSEEIDWDLWDKFLKYDLCITDYDSLTDEEKKLCKFIFETERSAEGTVICERARRTLAGDENIGDRITLEQLYDAYGIWDNYSATKFGYQSYIHCVPDIKCLNGWNDYNEYWLDDEGTVRIQFTGENSGVNWDAFKILGDFSYDDYEKLSVEHPELTWDGNNGYQITVKKMPIFDKEYVNNNAYFISDEYIEMDGNYYYIRSDNTAVLVKSALSLADYPQSEIEPITEPVLIPAEVNGCPLVAIESQAFRYAPITEVILPDTLLFIDSFAFEACENLEKINFPEGLEYIGDFAFSFTKALTNIEINCPKLNIQRYSFEQSGITDVNLMVKSIGEYAFKGCWNLKNITLGDDVARIGANAFKYCDSLENIELPSSVRIIGEGAFTGDGVSVYSCGVKSITISPNVEIIGALPVVRGEGVTSGIYIPATDPLTDEAICAFESDCVINGWYNTEAHRYAVEWGLKFNPLDEEIAYGDTNLDGEIGIADAVVLQSYVVGDDVTIGFEADLTKDGIIDVFDLSSMRTKLISRD